MNAGKIEALEQIIGYVFKNKELVKEALTHSSFANERNINKIKCNERLEFLGDAVLELVSSEYLFQKYPDVPEGELTKIRASLVCEPALAACAKKLQVGDLIFLGKGEDASGGRNKASIISDAMEAIIGAVYLDSGLEVVRQFIIANILDVDEERFRDHKSGLQEFVQAKNLGNISYEVVGATGPEHKKKFEVRVLIAGSEKGRGCGKNKKAAEQMAAFCAYKKYREEYGE